MATRRKRKRRSGSTEKRQEYSYDQVQRDLFDDRPVISVRRTTGTVLNRERLERATLLARQRLRRKQMYENIRNDSRVLGHGVLHSVRPSVSTCHSRKIRRQVLMAQGIVNKSGGAPGKNGHYKQASKVRCK